MIVLWVIAGLAATAWLGASFYIGYFQEKLIYPGDGSPFGEHAALKALGAEVRTAEREGQRLRYYWAVANDARAAVLVFHGNRDGAAERSDFVAALLPLGISVALAEYPGYAGDPLPTSEWPILRNALAAYDEIEALSGGLPLFMAGESLGTGVSTFVATRRKPRGLILASPYTSMADVAKYRYPWVPIHHMILHPIEARAWAPHVLCPVLCIHGTEDRTIPYSIGVHEAANFKQMEFISIEGAGHADLRRFDNGAFWKACQAFIERHS